MYIYIFVYMYKCIYIYVNMYVNIWAYMYICMYVFIYLYSYVCIYGQSGSGAAAPVAGVLGKRARWRLNSRCRK